MFPCLKKCISEFECGPDQLPKDEISQHPKTTVKDVQQYFPEFNRNKAAVLGNAFSVVGFR